MTLVSSACAYWLSPSVSPNLATHYKICFVSAMMQLVLVADMHLFWKKETHMPMLGMNQLYVCADAFAESNVCLC